MSEYYDKDRFESKRSKKASRGKWLDDLEVFKWPAVIILTVSGLFPIALAILVLFSQHKKRKAAIEKEMEAERLRYTQEQLERMAKERAAAEAKAVEALKKKKLTKHIRLLRTLGLSLITIGALLFLDVVIYLANGSLTPDLPVLTAAFLASGGILFGRGEYLNKISRRSQRYILAIGDADTMRIGEIAKRVNRPPAKVVKELQNLIDKGYLGDDAYIDHEKGLFARFDAVIEEKEKESPAAPNAEEGYSALLRDLRVANDRIPDEDLSAKIERLEQISALIFKEVEEHPEKRSRIHTFFDYYLPTTQKLLDTYAEFDEMGVEGENVSQAKERIKDMMDAIVEGFEHQLDQLYSADAMDVVSDIKVMETMLNRDTASAAKDFGFDRAKKPDEKDELKPQQLEM